KKEIFITFLNDKTSLRSVVELLDSIGYAPAINMSNLDDKSKKVADRSLYYKIGFLGFAFGNVMLFTFPQYLGLVKESDEQFFTFFSYLNMVISIPVVFYGGQDYLRSAWLGLKKRNLNIDVPISLGIISIFLWSVYETVSGIGHGYFDSLAGLIFFLLIGKWFQQKTYHSIEFERDYKSYFPIAVTKKLNITEDNEQKDIEKTVVVDKLEPGDTIIIKNNELIPADGILLKGDANIDYSFVTGESIPVPKQPGQKIFAGGKQIGSTMEMTVTKRVSQSYLTQLWNDSAFDKDEDKPMSELADKIGTSFTYVVLFIAFSTLIYWLINDPSKAIFSFAAVLVVACPCAVALSIPFTFGNGMRILGRNDFYIKNTGVFESIQKLDRVVFDKTGTLTYALKNEIIYEGIELSKEEKVFIKSLTYHSHHPISRQIYENLNVAAIEFEGFKEYVGKGISGTIEGHEIKVGSESFVNDKPLKNSNGVFVSIDGVIKGKFIIKNKYRKGLKDFINYFASNFKLALVSGDSDSERENLEKIFPPDTVMLFNRKPKDKLEYITSQQEKGEKIMFFGDGLNDAGALQKSNVGVVITENINNFTPASDVIVSADKFSKIKDFIDYIRKSRYLIYAAYIIAFMYNVVGISFAASGNLSPLIAAILMPISSVSVVLFGVTTSTLLAKRKKII
ncbi:MAG TPA: HAD family hydrolase, partial [Bacteroidetes bacterium]|nr:HAD family hydrolase [Bacteroidota bacterium]